MVMLSFFEVPRVILEKIDYYISWFYWQSDQHKKKYILARWSIICQPKDQEGIKIHIVDVQTDTYLVNGYLN
jgi:hypothetical protein